MRLLLTSAGLTTPGIVLALQKTLPKPFAECSLALIYTDSSEEQRERVRLRHGELDRLGFSSVQEIDASHVHSPDVLDRFDAIYVKGGNTFSILHAMRESGFDHVIVSFILRGGVYIGVSAGSILLGPNIECAGWGSCADSNDSQLQNTEGLQLVPFAVFPHFQEDLRHELQPLQTTVSYPVIPLTDTQAMLSIDGNTVRIG